MFTPYLADPSVNSGLWSRSRGPVQQFSHCIPSFGIALLMHTVPLPNLGRERHRDEIAGRTRRMAVLPIALKKLFGDRGTRGLRVSSTHLDWRRTHRPIRMPACRRCWIFRGKPMESGSPCSTRSTAFPQETGPISPPSGSTPPALRVGSRPAPSHRPGFHLRNPHPDRTSPSAVPIRQNSLPPLSAFRSSWNTVPPAPSLRIPWFVAD